MRQPRDKGPARPVDASVEVLHLPPEQQPAPEDFWIVSELLAIQPRELREDGYRVFLPFASEAVSFMSLVDPRLLQDHWCVLHRKGHTGEWSPFSATANGLGVTAVVPSFSSVGSCLKMTKSVVDVLRTCVGLGGSEQVPAPIASSLKSIEWRSQPWGGALHRLDLLIGAEASADTDHLHDSPKERMRWSQTLRKALVPELPYEFVVIEVAQRDAFDTKESLASCSVDPLQRPTISTLTLPSPRLHQPFSYLHPAVHHQLGQA